ncbi:hypothetical protein [Nostoc sp.]
MSRQQRQLGVSQLGGQCLISLWGNKAIQEKKPLQRTLHLNVTY